MDYKWIFILIYFFLWRSILSLQTVRRTQWNVILCVISSGSKLFSKVPVLEFLVLKGLKLKYSDYNNKCIDLHCLDYHRSYQYCLVPISVQVADPLVQSFRLRHPCRFQCTWSLVDLNLIRTRNRPVHEISNNVVYETSKGSDQTAHTRSLIRAFARRLNNR